MTTRTVDIEAAVAAASEAPAAYGTVELIAVRPADEERRLVDRVKVDPEAGVEGDNWLQRAGKNENIAYGTQVTLMNSRFADAVTPSGQGWEIAGDQFYVDYDISIDNAPAGSRLRIGSAVLEISEIPHTGCAKFSRRFGRDVLMATRTEEG